MNKYVYLNVNVISIKKYKLCLILTSMAHFKLD